MPLHEDAACRDELQREVIGADDEPCGHPGLLVRHCEDAAELLISSVDPHLDEMRRVMTAVFIKDRTSIKSLPLLNPMRAGGAIKLWNGVFRLK